MQLTNTATIAHIAAGSRAAYSDGDFFTADDRFNGRFHPPANCDSGDTCRYGHSNTHHPFRGDHLPR